MAFYGQFMANFTPEQQQTELVKIWAAIGVDTEKALIEHFQAQNLAYTDINGLYADVYRSWLAFFLRRVPNAFAPRTSVIVTNPSTNPRSIQIFSSYSASNPATLVSNGKSFVQPVDISLPPGASVHFEAIQGKVVNATGQYKEIISINTDKVDLSTLKVFLDGQEINEVNFTGSFTAMRFIGSWNPVTNTASVAEAPGAVHLSDGLSYEHRGQFYLVTRKGTAKIPSIASNSVRTETFYPGEYVMYDGSQWVRNMNSLSLLPKQMDAAYAVPYNGYFAYYQSGNLYIRIFPGNTVPDPEGRSYEVTFIDTDGSQGVAEADTLQYAASITDIIGNVVPVEVSNSATTLGYSSTDAGELSCLLRERLFATISISSIPEYTTWFNAQPEVGDCKVMSDFEKKLENNAAPDTGFVSVYLLDIEGNPILPTVGSTENENPVVTDLLTRIEPYKDVAALRVLVSPIIENVIRVKFESSSNDAALLAYITAIVTQFYSVEYTKRLGMSLFESLDLAQVALSIGNAYTCTGLSIEGFHYVSVQVSPSLGVSVKSFLGEKLGYGYYLYYEQEIDASGNLKFDSAGKPLYKEPVRLHEALILGDPNTSGIYTESGALIGNHVGGEVNILNNPVSGYPFQQGKVECYWPMQDPGILAIGQSDAVRKLASDCQDGAILVEKYNA